MNRKVNYLILAVFTIILSAGLIYFIYWLGRFNTDHKPKNYYKAIFHESVSGLNIASPVKYMGVKIGSVQKIELNPNEPNSVIVTFQIDKKIKLRKDSYAILQMEGITGLKYIEIEGGSKNAPVLVTSKSNPASIRTIPSFNAKLFETLSNTTDKLNTLLDNLNTILDPKKASHLQNTLIHLENISAYLDKNKHIFVHTLNNFNSLQNNFDNAIKKLTQQTVSTEQNLTKNISDMSKNIKNLSANTNTLINNLNLKIKKGEFDFKSAIIQSFKPVDNASAELKKATMKLENLIKELENSPSDILFKKSNTPKGPGE